MRQQPTRTSSRAATTAATYLEDDEEEEEEESEEEMEVEGAEEGMVEGTEAVVEEDVWMEKGHVWLGKRLRRFFDGVPSDGTLVKWMPASGGEAALFHMEHEDGTYTASTRPKHPSRLHTQQPNCPHTTSAPSLHTHLPPCPAPSHTSHPSLPSCPLPLPQAMRRTLRRTR